MAIIISVFQSKLFGARTPVNYRGVSLLSTTSYTGVLNARLGELCEDIPTDEQNDLAKLYHVYIISIAYHLLLYNALHDKKSIIITKIYEEKCWPTRCMAKPKLRANIKRKEQLGLEKYICMYVACHQFKTSDMFRSKINRYYM